MLADALQRGREEEEKQGQEKRREELGAGNFACTEGRSTQSNAEGAAQTGSTAGGARVSHDRAGRRSLLIPLQGEGQQHDGCRVKQVFPPSACNF